MPSAQAIPKKEIYIMAKTYQQEICALKLQRQYILMGVNREIKISHYEHKTATEEKMQIRSDRANT